MPSLKVVLVILSCAFLQFIGGISSFMSVVDSRSNQETASGQVFRGKKIKPEGYQAIIRFEEGFLAVGSGGRVDRVSVKGEILESEVFPGENFNCLLSVNQSVIIAGDKGTVMISSEKGKFRKVDSGTTNDINSLTFFNDHLIIAADQGIILAGNVNGSFRKIQLALKGNIVSVSARASECFGVTDEGEIIHSVNGDNWDISDFNRIYAGYYKSCIFTSVLVTENRIAVAGVRDDGFPVLMFSNRGGVWTDRPLNFNDDQGITDYLTGVPNDIFYDEQEDQFYLACSKGQLLKVPPCSHCNKLMVLSVDDLEGISSLENTMMVVGGSFFIKAVTIR